LFYPYFLCGGLKVESFNGDGLVGVESAVELFGGGSGGLLFGDGMCRVVYFV
jgi:hypothetical protein